MDEFTIWDPTYFHYDRGGAEYRDNVDFEVVVRFPETENPREVKISDKATGDLMLAVDLREAVLSFCAEHPQDPQCLSYFAVRGDLDGDSDVDQSDVNILLGYRNKPASACPACDLDGDGMITALDARKLVLLCTRPRCATQ